MVIKEPKKTRDSRTMGPNLLISIIALQSNASIQFFLSDVFYEKISIFKYFMFE